MRLTGSITLIAGGPKLGTSTSHGDECRIGGYSTFSHSDMSNWGGYALTQGSFYLDQKSYTLVGPQLMLTTPRAFAFGQALIRDKSMAVFHSGWA